VTTTAGCTGACTSTKVEVSSNNVRVVPRPAATGTGGLDQSASVGLIGGLVLLAGAVTGTGASALRRRP
jgi:hypothetical protein